MQSIYFNLFTKSKLQLQSITHMLCNIFSKYYFIQKYFFTLLCNNKTNLLKNKLIPKEIQQLFKAFSYNFKIDD